MSEQPTTVPATRLIRDVAAVFCLVAAFVIVTAVAWWHGVTAGLLVTAVNLGLVGVGLGSSRSSR